VGDLQRHRDPPLVLARHLALAEEGDGLAQGQVAPRRLVEQGVEPVADRRQLQPGQHGEKRLVVDRHHQPPPATASYSLKARSRSR
jgi:hypothetical protein